MKHDPRGHTFFNKAFDRFIIKINKICIQDLDNIANITLAFIIISLFKYLNFDCIGKLLIKKGFICECNIIKFTTK
jgi:hypothetical protein